MPRSAAREPRGKRQPGFLPCVGRFIEFYGPQRLLASRILGLRAACIDRGRFALTAGFPTGLCEIYLLRAIRQGVVVVVVREETARQSRAVATRLPSSLLIPLRDYFLTGISTLLSPSYALVALTLLSPIGMGES